MDATEQHTENFVYTVYLPAQETQQAQHWKRNLAWLVAPGASALPSAFAPAPGDGADAAGSPLDWLRR